MPSRNLLVIVVAAAVSLACYSKAENNRYTSVVGHAMGLIERDFIEKVDRRKLFEGAMQGMVASLDDQYSSFIPPRHYTAFQEGLDQEFGGIGIIVEQDPKTKHLVVMSPLVNTPAYAAGLQAGDVILKIDGKPTDELASGEAVTLMRGKPGTGVHLVLRRRDSETTREVRIRREIIPVESVQGDLRNGDGSWQFYLADHPRIGYIRVSTFGDHTIREMRGALAQYEKHPIDALIFDLRDNAGGYLNAAVEVSNMFVDQGRIVSTRGRDGEVRVSYEATPSRRLFPKDKPMVVLVNTYTASASEIVAACLQDHGRAAVAGVRSWGKGTVQNLIPLEGGHSAIKLTTATYWRPSGANIHRLRGVGEEGDWGVSPNEGLRVPLDRRAADKLYRLRRLRDIVLRPGEQMPNFEWAMKPAEDAAEEAEPSDAEPTEAEERREEEGADPQQAERVKAWSDDPQLQRAIQHLLEFTL